MNRALIGVDEAGRGPLAGPVAVGVVLLPPRFNMRLLQGVRDSKQLSEKSREEWFATLCILEKEYGVRWSVQFSSASYIDTRGISPAIRVAMARALGALKVDPHTAEVRLDGGLKAPDSFVTQKTIIRGDQTEPVISLASVAAKVMRDRLMRKLGARYPTYGFEIHKGYGTRKHYQALREFGLSEVHRKTFCKLDIPHAH